MSASSITLDRRSVLKSGAAVAGMSAVSAPLSAFSQSATGFTETMPSPYGPISPKIDQSTGLPLLQLPDGFTYRSFGWTGDLMNNGQPIPPRHDGMAVVEERGPLTILIRNHENFSGSDLDGNPLSTIGARGVYDDIKNADLGIPEGILGGCTTVILRNGEFYKALPAIGGTIVNCAGGVTPWGTWLTCEETRANLESFGGLKHGYVFEVPWTGNPRAAQPIVEMGRFSHEAVAVDPNTGYVYLTEDSRNRSALYRFEPTFPQARFGALARGGKLFAARVVGQPGADVITPSLGDSYQLEWVEITEPDADPDQFSDDVVEGEASGPFIEARANGCLRMSRGEGAWYSTRDGLLYFVDTSAGVDGDGRPGRGEGAVWVLDPRTNILTAIYVSQARLAGNNPDNLTVSPREGVVLCEDGGGIEDEFGFGERLLGLMPSGAPFTFAKNNIMLETADIIAAGKSQLLISEGDFRRQEWAGACFNASGDTMYVNVQTPGLTFAIKGPWTDGPL